MVVLNDFEVQIVSAEDDRRPFKEHTKDLKTYVEVEPDIEYFISLRKIKVSTSDLYVSVLVDGRCIRRRFYKTDCIDCVPGLYGISSRSKNILTTKALRFVKASFVSEAVGITSTVAGMGKIEVKIFEPRRNGKRKVGDYEAASFNASPVRLDDESFLTRKKNIRSEEGHRELKKHVRVREFQQKYKKGVHLYSITLHYCATPGLIAVGVLPKPPLWEHHRMMKPEKLSIKEKEKLEKCVHSVKRNRNGNEIVELLDDDSDDDSHNNLIKC